MRLAIQTFWWSHICFQWYEKSVPFLERHRTQWLPTHNCRNELISINTIVAYDGKNEIELKMSTFGTIHFSWALSPSTHSILIIICRFCLGIAPTYCLLLNYADRIVHHQHENVCVCLIARTKLSKGNRFRFCQYEAQSFLSSFRIFACHSLYIFVFSFYSFIHCNYFTIKHLDLSTLLRTNGGSKKSMQRYVIGVNARVSVPYDVSNISWKRIAISVF